jgi:hypothetical protein
VFEASSEANTIVAMRPAETAQRIRKAAVRADASALARSVGGAGRKAGTDAGRAGIALVQAVGRLVSRAVDEILLSDTRVTSAAEGRRVLAGDDRTESLAEDIQRVIVLAVPVIRVLTRGARLVKVPWVIVGSTAISVGVAVRLGVREIQVLSSLVAHRLEEATGAPADPALVKRVALDLYLHPKRKRRSTDEKLHLVRLTRKWLLAGFFGRNTAKRADQALAAAERFDAAALAASWDGDRRRPDEPPPRPAEPDR